MAHVFIVDERTLCVHLRYMFAGTGAKDYNCSFLDQFEEEIKPSIERLLSGMIADISRVKPGDNILFYLQQTANHEGMFFGSFKVKENPFLCDDNYLIEELGKNLTFRVLIESNEVYSKGITERECLDSLEEITHPSQLCWSLIYRKLKGNRGCTMITDFEYNQIMKKIRKLNNNIKIDGDRFNYNSDANEIVNEFGNFKYVGDKKLLNIKDRLLFKKKRKNAYETHLQAFILQNILNLPQLKVNELPITWIGNEVSCGVGMQSIDIAFIQEDESTAHFVICELKDEQPVNYIQKQIEKYVTWMKEYIVPTYSKKIVIHPTIIAPIPKETTKLMIQEIINSTIYNSEKVDIKEIRYIGFSANEMNITLEEINYE